MSDGKLRKELGLLDVFCIATGAMISSGLFILPGIAAPKTGPSLFLSYLIASLLAIPAMFSNAELTTAMPKTGGDYFFITRSMGFAVGVIGGMASWFSLSLKSAFALIGMGAYTSIITDIPIVSIGIFLCIFFMLINIIGIREASTFQRFLVIGLFVALFFYVFRGFPSVEVTRFVPFSPYGAKSVFATAGFVFISYGGLTKIASISEEIRDPGKNIPLGMILSLLATGILYSLVVFVTTGVLDAKILYHSLTPISEAAYMFMGTSGAVIMAVAAILAFVSTANTGIMSASRYPIAMARDSLLPRFFKDINNRFKTPHYSIFFTGIFMIFAIAFLKFDLLVRVASTFLILLYILANLAVVIMRESKIQNYRPKFMSPFYPWIQILGIIGGVFLLFEMGREVYVIVFIFMLLAFLWYLFYASFHIKKEFALVHIIERITNKELTTYTLESELRKILLERDEIIEDRFDRLISKCIILDVEGPLGLNDFFRMASDSLSKRLNIDKDALFNLFVEREKQTTTVIRPGLAIPHIIIDGSKKFDILLARCKRGIKFRETEIPVYAVFVLLGSRDERNFHLRALASIAQITESRDFDKKWLNAKSADELRDVVLLASRRRHMR